MRTIYTQRGTAILVDDADYEILSRHCWHVTNAGYAARNIPAADGDGCQLMHRRILAAGRGIEVDHIDGNPLNNQRENLRLCSHAQNMLNKKTYANNTSGMPGVSLHKQSMRWRARIKIGDKYKHLGMFDQKEAAFCAYIEAAKAHHGGFNRAAR